MPSFWATWCWPPSPRRSAGPRSCCRARCGRCRRSRSRRPSDVSAIDDLIAELARLPGIGRKTAQRLTFHLLQQTSDQATRLAATLVAVAERGRACEECGNLTEEQPCAICRDPRRDAAVVCVVEEASTVAVVDRSTDFRGRYHVLGGGFHRRTASGPRHSGWIVWWFGCARKASGKSSWPPIPPWRARSPPPISSSSSPAT